MLVCFLLIVNSLREDEVADKEETPSVGEVLEVIATYRAQLVAEHGEKWVKNQPTSDDWGAGRMAVALLLKEPDHWRHILNDEVTRRRAHEWILSLLKTPAKA